MLTFNLRFFLLTLVLFVIEVLIALFVHDRILRPYGGDFLVTILTYCAGRTLIKASPWKIAIGALLFSYTVEILQYFNIVDRLALSDNLLAKMVIGYGFEWLDLVAYTLGIITVLILERLGKENSSRVYR